MIRDAQVNNSPDRGGALDRVIAHAAAIDLRSVSTEAGRPVVFDDASVVRCAELTENLVMQLFWGVEQSELSHGSQIAETDGRLGDGQGAQAVGNELSTGGVDASRAQCGGKHAALALADAFGFAFEGGDLDRVPIPAQEVVAIAAAAFDGLCTRAGKRRVDSIGQRVPAMGNDDGRLAGIDRVARMSAAGIVQQHALSAVPAFLQNGRIEPAARRDAAEQQ